MGKSVRLSNFDLLKIICMLMIVFSHFCVHGNWPLLNVITYNNYFLFFFGILGNLAVNCYVLITAYFMINKQLNLERILRLLFKMIFFGVGIYVLLCTLNSSVFDFNELIKYLPFKEKSYWFMDTYILMIIFSPALNLIIQKTTRKQLFFLIVTGLLFSSVISTIYLVDTIVSYLFWFIILYFIGGYLRLYGTKNRSLLKQIGLTILGVLLVYLSVVLLRMNEINTGVIIGNTSYYFAGRNRLIVLFASLQIFLLFSMFKIKPNKIITFMSLNCLGVYLTHDNTALRYILWHKLLNVGNLFYSRGMIVYAILIVIFIFFISIMLSYLSIIIFENPLFYLLRKPINYLQMKYDEIWVNN